MHSFDEDVKQFLPETKMKNIFFLLWTPIHTKCLKNIQIVDVQYEVKIIFRIFALQFVLNINIRLDHKNNK